MASTLEPEPPKGPHHYRLYSKDGVFLRDCMAANYDTAKQKLQANDDEHDIWSVDEYNHEVKCGIEMDDEGEEWKKAEEE